MRAYFRLLPVTMFCAFMLMAIKLGQTIESGESLFDKLFIGSVAAEEAKEEEEKADSEEKKSEDEAEKPAEDEEKKPEEKSEDKKAEDAKSDAKDSKEDKESKDEKKSDAKDAEGKDAKDEKGEKAEGKEGEKKGEDDPFFKPIFSGSKKEYRPEDLIGNQLGGTRPDDRRFSPVELQLLQQLSERRLRLDEREKTIELKENLLSQTEMRVNEKFDEMTNLKTELAELIRRYNEIEETKLRSLVKIYENMKPKDAARIFDEVEMPILLMVIDQMSEKRAAPILAAMNSKKAKQITVELAEARRLQDEKIANERAAAMPSAPVPAPAKK